MENQNINDNNTCEINTKEINTDDINIDNEEIDVDTDIDSNDVIYNSDMEIDNDEDEEYNKFDDLMNKLYENDELMGPYEYNVEQSDYTTYYGENENGDYDY